MGSQIERELTEEVFRWYEVVNPPRFFLGIEICAAFSDIQQPLDSAPEGPG